MPLEIDFLDITRIKLMETKIKINEYLDQEMEDYYNNYIIPEIQSLARGANAPEEFVQGFKFVRTGRNKGKIINTFGSKEVPLAKWWNYGTKRNYRIAPKVEHPRGTERAARDKEDIGGGSVQHPEKLNWVDETGAMHFAYETIHPGRERILVMEKGTQIGGNRMIQEVKKNVQYEFGGND